MAALAAVRLLVIDDSPDICLLFRRFFERTGAQVETFLDAASGIAFALSTPPEAPFDLVLVDLEMPEMNGFTAVAALRRAGYRGTVLALSAHEDQQAAALASGFDGYLRKAGDWLALSSELQEWVGRAAANE